MSEYSGGPPGDRSPELNPPQQERAPVLPQGAVHIGEAQFALLSALIVARDNPLTEAVAASRQRTGAAVAERLLNRRFAVKQELRGYPLSYLRNLPTSDSSSGDEDSVLVPIVRYQGSQAYYQAERTHPNPLRNAYNDMVALCAAHNTKRGHTEELSARSRGQAPEPLFGPFGLYLGNVQPSPESMLNPRAIAAALAVDTELRVAGQLSHPGAHAQREEARAYLTRPLEEEWTEGNRPYRSDGARTGWDLLCAEVAAREPDMDVIALLSVLNQLHPDYSQYGGIGGKAKQPNYKKIGVGPTPLYGYVEGVHRPRRHSKIQQQAEEAIIQYGGGNRHRTPPLWLAQVRAEANLRLLTGDADLETAYGRRITMYRDQRLLRTLGGVMPINRLPSSVGEIVSFCRRRYNIEVERDRIEHREHVRDGIRAVLSESPIL